jgi:hypothetical protein
LEPFYRIVFQTGRKLPHEGVGWLIISEGNLNKLYYFSWMFGYKFVRKIDVSCLFLRFVPKVLHWR